MMSGLSRGFASVALAICVSAVAASAAQAAPTQLRFMAPTTTTGSAPYRTTPYRPGDPATPAGAVTYARYAVDDSAAAPSDRGEKGFVKRYGLDYDGTPLEGDLWVDYDALARVGRPVGLPVVMLLHGGITGSVSLGAMRPKGTDPWASAVRDPCTADGRWGLTMRRWVEALTARGYIVFNASFRRADRASDDALSDPLLVQYTKPAGPGDCLPDAQRWEGVAYDAQVSAQLAVRSVKQMLRGYAERYAGVDAARPAMFEAASRKVVVRGHSFGGHVAARLALRSDDADVARASEAGATDTGGTQAERRISAAFATGSVGECTASNPVTDWTRVKDLMTQRFVALQQGAPMAGCSVTPDPQTDAPLLLYQARPYLQLLGQVEPSQLSGTYQTPWAAGWGDGNLGWDRVVDNRWPARFCAGQTGVVPGTSIPRCVSRTYDVYPEGLPHNDFPFSARKKTGSGNWASLVVGDVDAFFRQPALPAYGW